MRIFEKKRKGKRITLFQPRVGQQPRLHGGWQILIEVPNRGKKETTRRFADIHRENPARYTVIFSLHRLGKHTPFRTPFLRRCGFICKLNPPWNSFWALEWPCWNHRRRISFEFAPPPGEWFRKVIWAWYSLNFRAFSFGCRISYAALSSRCSSCPSRSCTRPFAPRTCSAQPTGTVKSFFESGNLDFGQEIKYQVTMNSVMLQGNDFIYIFHSFFHWTWYVLF